MTEMMFEELQLLQKINKLFMNAGFRSRLAYIFVSGFREGFATEWGFVEPIKEEAVAVNIMVSEEVRKLAS
jgi:hypothetical protein